MHIWEESKPFGMVGANSIKEVQQEVLLKRRLSSDPKRPHRDAIEFGRDPVDVGEIGCGFCASQGRLAIFHHLSSIQECV